MKKLYSIYFSATGTTLKCVEKVCAGLGIKEVSKLNLADKLNAELPEFMDDDVVVVGVPVYGGRVPAVVADALSGLIGTYRYFGRQRLPYCRCRSLYRSTFHFPEGWSFPSGSF